MRSLLVAASVFVIVFGGALAGALLQARLPPRHRDEESKETVHLVMGLVATMAALVLSLLIASAHASYTTQQEEVQKLAADIILLDEALVRYGPETLPLRNAIHQDIAAAMRTVSSDEGVGSAKLAPDGVASGRQRLFETMQNLAASSPAQRFDKDKALDLMTKIASTRLLIHEQISSSVPVALIVILVVWLMLLFLGFGLFAQVNGTVLASLLLGAFSVAAAIFLILDMSHPYSGIIHADTTPIRNAFEQINR